MRINNIHIDDLIELEEDILKNFGSLKRFSEQTKISYRYILKLVNTEDFTKEDYQAWKAAYEKEMDRRDDRDEAPGIISDNARAYIRLTILTHYSFLKYFSIYTLSLFFIWFDRTTFVIMGDVDIIEGVI